MDMIKDYASDEYSYESSPLRKEDISKEDDEARIYHLEKEIQDVLSTMPKEDADKLHKKLCGCFRKAYQLDKNLKVIKEWPTLYDAVSSLVHIDAPVYRITAIAKMVLTIVTNGCRWNLYGTRWRLGPRVSVRKRRAYRRKVNGEHPEEPKRKRAKREDKSKDESVTSGANFTNSKHESPETKRPKRLQRLREHWEATYSPDEDSNESEDSNETVVTSEEERYDIESIVSYRKFRFKNQYLVKWKGYSDKDNSWVDEDMINDGSGILEKYKSKLGMCLKGIGKDTDVGETSEPFGEDDIDVEKFGIGILPNEKWRRIPELRTDTKLLYEYFVSDKGRISRKGATATYGTNNGKYLTKYIYFINGERRKYSMDRLVMYGFHGIKDMLVRRRNKDILDNRLCNLFYGGVTNRKSWEDLPV